MRVSLGDVSLWFDVSGPSVIPQGDTTVERPVLVAVHGGPGLDHMTVKPALEPLAGDFQVLYFDLRGHGRSDRGSAESWNMRTWADDLRRLCDALGLRKPVTLGSSFGGDVALTYAALFPDHPGGVILANTTGGHQDSQRVTEAFGRLGGPEAAALIQRIYADLAGDYQAEFNRRNPDVASHYNSHEAPSFDPWSLTGAVRCPILVLAPSSATARTSPSPPSRPSSPRSGRASPPAEPRRPARKTGPQPARPRKLVTRAGEHRLR